jgi:RimJ/RimL family protein N-acetyltransferase
VSASKTGGYAQPTMQLRGRYVALRPLETRDAETTLRWRLGERAALLNRGATTVEEQRAWIASRPSSERNFVIELLDGRPVGMLSLIDVDLVHGHAEPSRFLIGEPDAVRGVPAAVEAMLLLYRLAFDELGLHRVYGTIAAQNRQMIKWQAFLGMTEEGRLRDHYVLDGRRQDAVCMGMLEAEYRTVALPRMRALVGDGAAVPATREH